MLWKTALFYDKFSNFLYGSTTKTILPCGNLCQYNVISAVFYSDRDIKIGHSIFRTISEKKNLS